MAPSLASWQAWSHWQGAGIPSSSRCRTKICLCPAFSHDLSPGHGGTWGGHHIACRVRTVLTWIGTPAACSNAQIRSEHGRAGQGAPRAQDRSDQIRSDRVDRLRPAVSKTSDHRPSCPGGGELRASQRARAAKAASPRHCLLSQHGMNQPTGNAGAGNGRCNPRRIQHP